MRKRKKDTVTTQYLILLARTCILIPLAHIYSMSNKKCFWYFLGMLEYDHSKGRKVTSTIFIVSYYTLLLCHPSLCPDSIHIRLLSYFISIDFWRIDIVTKKLHRNPDIDFDALWSSQRRQFQRNLSEMKKKPWEKPETKTETHPFWMTQ